MLNDKIAQQIIKKVASIRPMFGRIFEICYSGLELAERTLNRNGADDVVSIRNRARSGASLLVDVTTEEYIVSKLTKERIAVLSEEKGFSYAPRAKHFAILDPIDGTSMAIRGMDFYSVCLAVGPLMHGKMFLNSVEFAVVCSPRAIFHAVRDGGAFQNGKLIHTSDVVNIRHSIIRIPKRLSFRTEFLNRVASILSLGSTSLEICLVANGEIDCYIETKRRKIFDFAAPFLIVKEAGGIVSSLANTALSPRSLGPLSRSTLLVAANNTLHRKILNELSR